MNKEHQASNIYGYCGTIMGLDLTKRKIISEFYDEAVLRKYVGGTGLGIKIIYDEVPPEVDWCSPDNRLFLGSGPLGGTSIGGSGTMCGVTN